MSIGDAAAKKNLHPLHPNTRFEGITYETMRKWIAFSNQHFCQSFKNCA